MDSGLEAGGPHMDCRPTLTPLVRGHSPELHMGCGPAAWEMSQGMRGVSAGFAPASL